MEEWGDVMRKAYGRTTEYRDSDLSVNYLGYYTDNGMLSWLNILEKEINFQVGHRMRSWWNESSI